MASETILWRRLDKPGHDACRLMQRDDGWLIKGAAAFRHEAGAAALNYEIECDPEWRTRQGVVKGWVGSHRVGLRITRNSTGSWILNGRTVPNLQECVDLDLGFTPATNLPQLRRIELQVGQAAVVPVAWLDPPFGSLELLQQHYERRTDQEYWYEAPRFDYAALLQVSAVGFVQRYPNLWEAEFQSAHDAG